MKNFATAATESGAGFEQAHMVQSEIDLLVGEYVNLLRLAGLAMIFIDRLDPVLFTPNASDAARALASHIERMPDAVISDALELVYGRPRQLACRGG